MDYVEEAWRIVDPRAGDEHAGSRIRAGDAGARRSRRGHRASRRVGELVDDRKAADVMADADRKSRGRSAELTRLEDAREWDSPWRKWGPYLSERQWGTVREDYSPNGDAWKYFPHDHARSRAYHWGEDGLAGFSDLKQRLCFAAGALEREGPDSEGAALRLEQRRGQPRRGREGVLLLSRFHADPLVHEVAVQVPPGGVSRTTIS